MRLLQFEETVWAIVTLLPILHKLHYNRDRHPSFYDDRAGVQAR
ncbi:hypothetical protein GGC63_002666 [Paenibacillus sp. OAS669]|nr:hypothetical protein [Paenibacillus sp. OAS669]